MTTSVFLCVSEYCKIAFYVSERKELKKCLYRNSVLITLKLAMFWLVLSLPTYFSTTPQHFYLAFQVLKELNYM